MHHVPADPNTGWRVYALPSDVRVYLDAGAVVHGAVTNGGGNGKDTIVLEGYGTLSGEDQPRCPLHGNYPVFSHTDSVAGAAVGKLSQSGCCKDNTSPQGISLRNVRERTIPTHRHLVNPTTLLIVWYHCPPVTPQMGSVRAPHQCLSSFKVRSKRFRVLLTCVRMPYR